MASAPPRLLLRKSNDAPTPAPVAASDEPAEATTEPPKATASTPAKARRTKSAPLGIKVMVRWLPPGMTTDEFLAVLGPEWAVGGGKVGWFSYGEGKVFKNPIKPSRPSVAWLHLVEAGNFIPLAEHVQNATWTDAKDSFNDPCLLAPPVLERAPYQRVPPATTKTDPRQGTIDQDPEFQAFLASLTQPDAPKDGATASGDKLDESDDEPQRMTTTPLIDFLREKRAKEDKAKQQAKLARAEAQAASKAKAAAAAAASIKEEAQKRRSEKGGKADKADKADKTDKQKEPIRILKKAASSSEPAGESSKSATATETKSTPSAAEMAKSRRAGVAAAARILQRDLGLGPAQAHRRARQDIVKTEKTEKTEDTTESEGPKEPEPRARQGRDKNNTSEGEPAASSTSTAGTASERPQTPASAASKTRARGRGSKNADTNKTPASLKATSSQPTPIAILKRKPDKEPDEQSKPEGQSAAEAAPASAAKDQPSASSSPVQKPTDSALLSSSKAGPSTPAPKKGPITPGATKAFVKHVQLPKGVTEEALRAKLEEFGTVTSIEIEKRKGYAYVDFGEHQALVDAAAAGPIRIAQGSVLVVERKDKKPGGAAVASSVADDEGGRAPEKEKGRGGDNDRGRGLGDGDKGRTVGGNDKGRGPERERERERDKDKDKKTRGRRGRGGGGGGGSSKGTAPAGGASEG